MASRADIEAALGGLGYALIDEGDLYARADATLTIAKSGVAVTQRGAGREVWLMQNWALTLRLRKATEDALDAAALGVWNALRTAGVAVNFDTYEVDYGPLDADEFREADIRFQTTDTAML